MNELLRFTALGECVQLAFKSYEYEFVFYEKKMEIIKKGEMERAINYQDIEEIVMTEGNPNSIFINCKPIGVNIYQISDEIYNKITEITAVKKNKTNYILDEIPYDEINQFIKIKKDKKIVIELINKVNLISKYYMFNFETNVIYNIPGTDINFAIALTEENDEYFNFFINQGANPFNRSVDIPTRTSFPGITDKYNFSRYIYDYKEQQRLKIDTKGVYYLEISVNKF